MASDNKTPGKRIVFLDSLRALAVLIVLWGHVFSMGINDPGTISAWVPDVTGLAFGPTTIADNIHGQIGLWLHFTLGIGAGGLGVSLFFIISGFVILRTVDRTPPLQFMVQRFFRIIPTCLFCVSLVALITYIYCASRGLHQPNSITNVITSAFAANYFNSAFSTVPVLWTLEVEMIFYVVMALGVLAFNKLGYKALLAISLSCLAFVASYAISEQAKPDIYRHFSTIAVHLSYMMIGAFIYRAYENNSILEGICYVAISVATYYGCYELYGTATSFQNIGSNFSSALGGLIIFIAGLFAGLQWRFLSPLRWIASISYPLYLLHVPLAWGGLYTLASFGVGMYWSAVISTAVVIALAWITHHAIEIPSQAIGKKVSSLLKSRSPAVEGGIA
jgi:peptidoglycan/LPS O-acetylase OafA/YrhL